MKKVTFAVAVLFVVVQLVSGLSSSNEAVDKLETAKNIHCVAWVQSGLAANDCLYKPQI